MVPGRPPGSGQPLLVGARPAWGPHAPPSPRGCCAASDPRPHLSHGGRGADSVGLAARGGGLAVTLTECRRLIFHRDGARGFLWPACQTGGRPRPGVAVHVSGGKEPEGWPVPRIPWRWPRLHVGPRAQRGGPPSPAPSPRGADAPLSPQAESSSHPLLLAGYEDGSLALWDVSTRKVCSRVACHSEPVMGLALDPRWARGVSGSAEKALAVWSLEGPQALQVSGPGRGFIHPALRQRSDGLKQYLGMKRTWCRSPAN